MIPDRTILATVEIEFDIYKQRPTEEQIKEVIGLVNRTLAEADLNSQPQILDNYGDTPAYEILHKTE